MIIIFIDKLNLRFVKIFDYIQRFELNIRHKSNKQHIVSNILFKLININIDTIFDENELNVLFITILIEVEKNFFKKIIENYFIDLNWIFFCCVKQAKRRKRRTIFFIKKSTNSFFVQTNLSLTITRMSRVVCVYFIRLFKTFSSSHMTIIILNLLAVMKEYRLIITFAILLNIFAIFWNIVLNVKRIKHVDICRTIFCNSFLFFRYFFTRSLLISFWFYRFSSTKTEIV